MIDETLKKAFNDFYDYITEHDIIKAAHEYSEKTVFTEALTAIYEIGLGVMGAEIDNYTGTDMEDWQKGYNAAKSEARKAWAKACGVAEK